MIKRKRIRFKGESLRHKYCKQCKEIFHRDSKASNLTDQAWRAARFCSLKCYHDSKSNEVNDTRTVKFIGRNMLLTKACELAEKPYKLVDRRLRNGWSLEKALTT